MTTIRNWYMQKYPTDDLGTEINPLATFEGLTENLSNVYDYLDVHDSIVRERVFEELADRAKVTYDYVYDKWLMR